MSLLISRDALARRRIAARGSLDALVRSLRRDLDPLVAFAPEIPREKALLSRDGGRCPRDGAALEFDPFAPHRHRCPVCGEYFAGERHHLAWVMWYQLWLAERAVHAASLHALTGEYALAELARFILSGYAERYAHYPNRDNVLGPGRPFFSTYLESIWLLQLCVALDLLELVDEAGPLAGSIRDRVIQPSAAIIASYDEGRSNRQVWNSAALLAAGRILDDESLAARALGGRSGVISHIEHGLLGDGSWYEGENYHFFAHRGLWYGVTIAECAGMEVPGAMLARFQEGFAAPLATVLPDLTFPSRRDSQYGISLRQWRFAESCELGLARARDPRLAAALAALYERGAAPRRDTGRWRSTAESERNEPASALGRADLGWRSLLLASEEPELPSSGGPASSTSVASVLMEGQGIAVFRRDRGKVYMALDYGESGGGHGHPDRLNLLLMRGSERWLDDMGTGSYVDPSLHWYRSTLAHNAPLVDGHSQPLADGVLRAWEERDDATGWVDAELPEGRITPGVRFRRSLVAMRDYSIDRLEWESSRDARIELPLHLAAEIAQPLEWKPAPIDGSSAPEDGFPFARAARCASVGESVTVELRRGGESAAWVTSSAPVQWWRAVAPGAPGLGEREFFVLRTSARRGSVTTVWNWGAALLSVRPAGEAVLVERCDGSRHRHTARYDSWEVERWSTGVAERVVLGGVRARNAVMERAPREPATPIPASEREYLATALSATSRYAIALRPGADVRFELARDDYRISEESWEEAGAPRASVRVGSTGVSLSIEVDVITESPYFRPPDAPDPRLDNENPDINSDGVQLHLYVPGSATPPSWLLVPEEAGGVRVHSSTGDASARRAALDSRWHRTPDGYAVSMAVDIAAIGASPGGVIGLRVVVNDMARTRTRRRGQLVLAGTAVRGERVYLRGDREDPATYLRFVIPNA